MRMQTKERIAKILVPGMMILLVILGLFREITADEFQLGILVLEMNRGRELYTQLWDNHGPLPAWLMAAVFHVWPFVDYAQWYLIRLAGLGVAFASIGTVWHGLRELYASRWERRLGLLTYLTFPAILLKSYELRSDLFVQLLWAAMVLLWIYSARKTTSAKARLLQTFAIGFLAGVAFGCSLKALFLCSAIGFATVMIVIKDRAFLMNFLGYISGGVLGLFVWLLPLALTNRLEAFHGLFVEKNINRTPPPFLAGVQKFVDWSPLNAVIVGGLFVILLLFALRLFKRGQFRTLGIGSMALLLLYAYCFVLPTFHAQSLLTLAVPLALVAPKLFSTLFAVLRLKLKKPLLNCLLPPAAGLLLIVSGLLSKDLFPLEMVEQVAWHNARRDLIPKDEPVFDGYGHPMTHSHPLHYTSWVETLRESQLNGTLPHDLIEEIKSHNIRWVIRDKRVRDLDESLNSWIKTHYSPTALDEVMELTSDAATFN